MKKSHFTIWWKLKKYFVRIQMHEYIGKRASRLDQWIVQGPCLSEVSCLNLAIVNSFHGQDLLFSWDQPWKTGRVTRVRKQSRHLCGNLAPCRYAKIDALVTYHGSLDQLLSFNILDLRYYKPQFEYFYHFLKVNFIYLRRFFLKILRLVFMSSL